MAATEAEILEKLQTAMLRVLKVDRARIVPSASFIEDLDVDSLDMVDLLMEIETDFDLEIPETALESLVKVGDAISFIQANT